MRHAYKSSTQEAETGRLQQVQSPPGLQSEFKANQGSKSYTRKVPHWGVVFAAVGLPRTLLAPEHSCRSYVFPLQLTGALWRDGAIKVTS